MKTAIFMKLNKFRGTLHVLLFLIYCYDISPIDILYLQNQKKK